MATQSNNTPVYVVPDGNDKTAYGNEMVKKTGAGTGLYDLGYGKGVYSQYSPGTKTKATRDAEAAKAKALADENTKAQSLANAVQASKTDTSSDANNGISGSLDDWLSQALKDTGQSQSLLPYLRTIAMKESSGNPNAINQWDSNWKAGHPSKGLMQTIDSTFNAYKLPGHDNIYNPVDNAIASIRYSISRYGGLQNVPGIKALAAGKGYVGY